MLLCSFADADDYKVTTDIGLVKRIIRAFYTSFEILLSHCPSQPARLQVYHTNRARPSASRSFSAMVAPHSGQSCSGQHGPASRSIVCGSIVSIAAPCVSRVCPILSCALWPEHPILSDRRSHRSYAVRIRGPGRRENGRNAQSHGRKSRSLVVRTQ